MTGSHFVKYTAGTIASSVADLTDNNITHLAWKGSITAEDFEYIPSAPEWDKLDNASFPTPIPAMRGTYDMPPLEKSGFPIIVK